MSDDSKVQGEGNYDAALEYDTKTTAFAKDTDKVKDAAEKAKDALDGPEAEALAEAEAEGMSPAKK